MGRISQRSKKRAEKEFNIYFKSMDRVKKKTALQLLEEQMVDYFYMCLLESTDKDNRSIKIDTFRIKSMFDRVREIEKKQIIDACKYGNNFEQGDLRCEVYYNKTYDK